MFGCVEDSKCICFKRLKQKVVVKWPQKNKALLPADYSIEGKTVRFDIFAHVL